MSKGYQKIYAIIFLLMLFGFSGFNIAYNWDSLVSDTKESIDVDKIFSDLKNDYDITSLEESTQTLNTIVNSDFVGGHFWNEFYGATYAVLGKNEENNFSYIKDKDGIEYYANFWNTPDISMKELAQRMRRMQEDLEPEGTKVILLFYPTRYDEEWSDGYYGMPYQDYNEYADELLRYVRRYGIDYIDYREVFNSKDFEGKEMFFKTDHHWNTQTAFFATTELVRHIRDTYGEDLDPERKYCNMNNYYIDVYKNAFMGSMGREVGEIYGGLDDYVLFTPKFSTSVRYSFITASRNQVEMKGTFNNTLIQKGPFQKSDAYEKDLNNVLINGVQLYDEIINEKAENDVSVMFIRNSYSSPVAVFLTPMVERIDMVWGLNLSEEEITERLKANRHDYVFIAVNVDNLDNEGNFSFYTEDTEVGDE